MSTNISFKQFVDYSISIYIIECISEIYEIYIKAFVGTANSKVQDQDDTYFYVVYVYVCHYAK